LSLKVYDTAHARVAPSAITKAGGFKNHPFAQQPGTPKSLSFENYISRHHNPHILYVLVKILKKNPPPKKEAKISSACVFMIINYRDVLLRFLYCEVSIFRLANMARFQCRLPAALVEESAECITPLLSIAESIEGCTIVRLEATSNTTR
jgi:hypothetical protein